MEKIKLGNSQKNGIISIIICYLIWGLIPFFWKGIEGYDALLILAYRVVLGFILILAFDLVRYGFTGIIKAIKNYKQLIWLFVAGILISLNWGTYIWAVTNGFVLETSIGYYINPLVTLAFSVIIFKEKLDLYKIAAIGLAVIGVLVMVLKYNTIPYIALILAFSFGIYGVIKKKVAVSIAIGLLFETLILLAPALVYLVIMESTGRGVFFNATPLEYVLFSLTGAVTVVPLLLFGIGAKRIPMATLGFLQFLSPTILLVLGLVVFKETLSMGKLVGLVFIGLGILVFILGGYLRGNRESKDVDSEREIPFV